jgi:isopentenyl-diphosphate delta-isomerase
MNIRTQSIAPGHARRKLEHIDISLNRDIEYGRVTTGLERYRFEHRALPEIDLEKIDLSVEFLGKTLGAPLFISSMVGGIDQAARINENLAEAAGMFNLAMGVGSQRCALEDPDCAGSFRVRRVAPNIFLCANLGAVQLNYGCGPDDCLRAVDMIEADALILHLNPLQEALQQGGNTRFSGILKKIEETCRRVPVPVIVKEVCFGISEATARDLASAGVACIDVAGAGGTSWSRVEGHRAPDREFEALAGAFADWGIPTTDAILSAARGAPGLPLIASGGIRTGVDAAKSIALGATLAATALPLFRSAWESAEAAASTLRVIIETLRCALFCSGSLTINELRNIRLTHQEDRHDRCY